MSVLVWKCYFRVKRLISGLHHSHVEWKEDEKRQGDCAGTRDTDKRYISHPCYSSLFTVMKMVMSPVSFAVAYLGLSRLNMPAISWHFGASSLSLASLMVNPALVHDDDDFTMTPSTWSWTSLLSRRRRRPQQQHNDDVGYDRGWRHPRQHHCRRRHPKVIVMSMSPSSRWRDNIVYAVIVTTMTLRQHCRRWRFVDVAVVTSTSSMTIA